MRPAQLASIGYTLRLASRGAEEDLSAAWSSCQLLIAAIYVMLTIHLWRALSSPWSSSRTFFGAAARWRPGHHGAPFSFTASGHHQPDGGFTTVIIVLSSTTSRRRTRARRVAARVVTTRAASPPARPGDGAATVLGLTSRCTAPLWQPLCWPRLATHRATVLTLLPSRPHTPSSGTGMDSPGSDHTTPTHRRAVSLNQPGSNAGVLRLPPERFSHPTVGLMD